MKFKQLLDTWQQDIPAAKTAERYSIRLTLDDAARIAALAELHPGTAVEQIVSDLLTTALDELEAAIPYVAGERVIREDDHGDPIYEDAGLTPEFLAKVREHRKLLESQS